MQEMASNTIKVLIVDDHAIMRAGLRKLIQDRNGIEVVGEASSGQEALKLVRSLSPEIVIMDILLQGENGIEVSRKILSEFPFTKIIALSSELNLTYINEAIRAGISGYVVKAAASEELMRAIADVMDHRIYFCPEVASDVVKNYISLLETTTIPASKPVLTDRERQLLVLVARGKRNKEIAEELQIAVKSAETFRLRLMKKLGCSSSNELTLYAIRKGLVLL